MATRLHTAGVPPMSMDEIDAEVKAYWAEHRPAVPAKAVWDDFFDAPGADLGDQQQLRAQEHDGL